MKKPYVKASERRSSQPTIEDSVDKSLLHWIIGLFVVIMPLLFCKWNDQSPFEMIKVYFSTVVILFVFTSYLLKVLSQPSTTFRWGIWIYGLLGYFAIYLISFALSNNYYASFWGVLNLPAGSVMSVATFVVMSFVVFQEFKTTGQLKFLSSCLVVMAFVMSIYGIIQHFGGDPINWWVYNEMTTRALSTMGQSVGYGTVLGCCLPLCFVFFIISKKIGQSLFWGAAWLSLNLGILYSGSRLPILGYFVTMAIFLGFLAIFRKRFAILNWKKIIIAFSLVLVANAIYFFEPGEKAIVKKLEVSRIKDGYSARFVTWNTAFKLWQKYPFFGTGPEVFGEEFNHIQTVEQNYVESWNLIWHKAHNEFIHYLATTGTIGFAAYLMLIGLMFVPFFKSLSQPHWDERHLFSVSLLGGFGFLLLTHMTAFSFVPTLMFFYIFPAMNFNLIGPTKDIEWKNPLPKNAKWGASIGAVVLAAFCAYTVWGVWYADIDYNDSRRALVAQGNFDKANVLLERAIDHNPWNAEYWCFRADINYNFLVRSMNPRASGPQTEATKRKYFDEVIASSDRCVSLDNQKSDLWRARGALFVSLSQLSPTLLDKSAEAFKKAIEVYPNSPFNHVSLGQVYRRKGRNDLAIQSFEKAISLKRDLVPAFAELMRVYYEEKRPRDVNTLVDTMRAVKVKESDFAGNVPELIKIARDNNDTVTANLISNF